MTEYTPAELARSIQRLEVSIDRLEEYRTSAPTYKDLEVRLSPIEVRVQTLNDELREQQDAQRWLTRTAFGALIIAILDPVLSAFGAA